MKRLGFCLWVSSFVTLILLCGFSSIQVQADMLLSDDFESYSVGTFPSSGGWEPHYNIINDPANNKVTDVTGYSGTKSLQLYGAHSGCWAAETGHPINFPSVFYIECAMEASGDMFTSGSCHYWDIALGLAKAYYGSGCIWTNLLMFHKSGNILGVSAFIQPLVVNTWYKIKVKVDMDNYTACYWINDEYKGCQTNSELTSPSTYPYLTLSSGSGKGWVDKIEVSTDIAQGVRLWCINSDETGLRKLADFNSWSINVWTPPLFSPDGSQIVFIKEYPVGEDRCEIWKVNTDGTGLVQLTDPGPQRYGHEWPCDWSPNGSKVSFRSERSNHNGWFEVWTMNASGLNQQNFGESNGLHASFSPDGSRIAYGKWYEGQLKIMNVDGSNKHTIRQCQRSHAPRTICWTKTNKIIFEDNPVPDNEDIYCINPDGTGLFPLVVRPGNDRFYDGDAELAISPDESKLVFYSNANGNYDIYTVNMDGTNILQLTTDPGADKEPLFSPDGSQIVWISEASGTKSIWIMNADGTGKRQLTDDSGEEYGFAVAATGTGVFKIAFYSSRPDVQTYSLSGCVFEDKNHNGTPEDGEDVAYATVVLLPCEQTLYCTDITDPEGHYAFNNVSSGVYTVTASKRGANIDDGYVTSIHRNLSIQSNIREDIPLVPLKTRNRRVGGWIPSFKYDEGKENFDNNKTIFTEISPSWYRLTGDGNFPMEFPEENLIIGDPSLIDSAHMDSVLVIPTSGQTNGLVVDSFLANNDLISVHVRAILDTIILNGYDGIDIDYEGFDPSYADEFDTFVSLLYNGDQNLGIQGLKELDKVLSVTVQPTDANSVVPLCYDYASIAQNCDELKIMCYDMNGGLFLPGIGWVGVLAQSPTNVEWWEDPLFMSINSVISYAKEKLRAKSVNLDKITLAIPTYGYQYPEYPFSVARKVIMYSADPFNVQFLLNSIVSPDQVEHDIPHGDIPHFTYKWYIGGPDTAVWYEDEMSYGDKMDFVLGDGSQFSGVKGVSIYRVDDMDDPLWIRVDAMIRGELYNPHRLIAILTCPADLEIRDPDGHIVNKDTSQSQVYDAIYTETQTNENGETIDQVIFNTAKQGKYLIRVIPEEGADPADQYSLRIVFAGDTYSLAENVLIRDIPLRPYGFWTIPVGSISGIVSDSLGGLLAVNVDIYDSLAALWQSVVTDDSGYYHVDSIPNGRYTATVVTPLGYQADQETKEFTIHYLPVRVDFSLTTLDITPSPRSRAYWAHQLHKALQNKPQDYTKADFSRFAGLINLHFNQNQVNPVDFYSVPQPASQQDSLMALKKLLHMCQGDEEPFLKRFAKAQLMALMLNVVSGKISQTEEISEDGRTVSQVITYCDMLVNDEIDCPDNIPGHGSPLCRYILADFILTFANLGLTVPTGVIPEDVIEIAYRIHNQEKLPEGFTLEQNYPNPFNPVCEIAYALPINCHVTLSIYNVLGQKVRVLVDKYEEVGRKSVTWDGRDEQDQEVTSGIYFYRIKAGDFVQSKKMVLLR